jgi:formylglycine-generating enzyme required for sulfatase activity
MNKATLSRREFIRLGSITGAAAILAACDINAFAQTTPTRTETLTLDPVFPKMGLVQPGSFQMGSNDGLPAEQPVHNVTLTRAYSLAAYAITFEEYDLFCKDTPHNKPDDRGWGRGKQPVIHVNWFDAVDYCNWLSEKACLTPCYSGSGKNTVCDFDANGYRLPTEAEWEFAARGGLQSRGTLYAGSNDPDKVAWYATDQAHPVGLKQPNELGLYDMCGNMFEWCWDWYRSDAYTTQPQTDPIGPETPQTSTPWELNRSRRGGSWREDAINIRITSRSADIVTYEGDNGFRVCRTVS